MHWEIIFDLLRWGENWSARSTFNNHRIIRTIIWGWGERPDLEKKALEFSWKLMQKNDLY